MKITLLFILINISLISQQDTTKFFAGDSLSIDSLKIIDTVVVQHIKPLDGKSFFINSEVIAKNDYRYTGDILEMSPFVYMRNLGSPGQPNQINIYGTGIENTNYLENGIIINNGSYYGYDLNYYQSEDIDSVEIVSLPRSFLYGVENNQATVNFITKDFIPPAPYSRIKYYEGDYGEAMIDFQFNTLFFKKLNFAVDITNRKADDRYLYSNHRYSYWQGKFKLKYLLSNKINLIANYFYNKSNVGLNGGIDLDSIVRFSSNVNDLLYDEISAPVKYNDRYLKTTINRISLKMLSELITDSYTDFTVYFQDKFEELRVNENLNQYKSKTFNDNQIKVFGNNLRHEFQLSLFNFSFISNYEYSRFNFNRKEIWFNSKTIYSNNYTNHSLSISALMNSSKLMDNLILAFYFKYYVNHSQYESEYKSVRKLWGYGADITWNLSPELSTYAGLNYIFKVGVRDDESIVNRPDYLNLQWRTSYANSNIGLSFNLFYRQYLMDCCTNYIPFLNSYTKIKYDYGIDFTFKYNYQMFFAEISSIFSGKKTESEYFYFHPNLILKTNIYYKDVLFDSSLNLKTGLELKYFSRQSNLRISDYSLNISYFIQNEYIPLAYTIDFFLAGEIQKVATVYFVWENLLDRKYYLVPYYPMPRRGIRFGISWEFLN
jgi:hypothetical protein